MSETNIRIPLDSSQGNSALPTLANIAVTNKAVSVQPLVNLERTKYWKSALVHMVLVRFSNT
jgi:hypothetical protein